MKMTLNRTAVVAALYAGLLALPAMAGNIYNSIPNPQPGNVPSLGYQATQTAEFGNLIDFAGTYRDITSVTVLMSDWALASTYGSTDPTWQHPLTFNLYNVDSSGATPQPGTLIATRTQTFDIPWRPEASAGCTEGGWGVQCYNGFAFTVTFDFTGVTVPNQLIYGLAFNTNTWGYAPIGASGPYESLNFGLSGVGPSVGRDVNPGTAYWNTMTAANYTDLGAGGIGTFRQDTNWAPYSGAVSFDTPEPATFVLFGMGFLCMGLVRRRSKKEGA